MTSREETEHHARPPADRKKKLWHVLYASPMRPPSQISENGRFFFFYFSTLVLKLSNLQTHALCVLDPLLFSTADPRRFPAEIFLPATFTPFFSLHQLGCRSDPVQAIHVSFFDLSLHLLVLLHVILIVSLVHHKLFVLNRHDAIGNLRDKIPVSKEYGI